MVPSKKLKLKRQGVHRSIYNRIGKNEAITRMIWCWHFMVHKHLLLSASGATMLQWNGESHSIDKSSLKNKIIDWLAWVWYFKIHPEPLRRGCEASTAEIKEKQRLKRLKLLTGK